MSKIVVKKADGEIIKIDENEALGELKRIRDKEKKVKRSSNGRRVSGSKKRTLRPSSKKKLKRSERRRLERREELKNELSSGAVSNQPRTQPVRQNSPNQKKRRKPARQVSSVANASKKILKRRLIGVLVTLCVVCVGAFGFLKYEINSVFSNMNTVEFPTSDEDLGINEYVRKYYSSQDKYIKNYALFGVDSRGKESGRTDTLMICSINSKTGEISLTSVLRDTYVKIAQTDDSNYGYDKINAAHSFGGALMTVKTLNENYDLNITDFVEVNFSAVVDIVDALGGIKLDIKEEELDNLNKIIKHNNKIIGGKKSKTLTKGGKQILDGKQALSYCRIRYVGNGDYQRTSRQRIVMDTILKTLKKESVGTQKKAMEAVLPFITTSLNSDDMWPILKAYIKGDGSIKSKAMTNKKIVKSGTINGGWCLIYDTLEANVKYLHKIIYGEDYTPSDILKEKSQNYINKTMYVTKYAIDSTVYNK